MAETVRLELPDYVQEDALEERLGEVGLGLMHKKYLSRDETGTITETPKERFYLLARSAAEVEKQYNKSEEEVNRWTRDFYEMISQLDFLPGGRIITNMGKGIALFNCYVLPVNDSIEEIFDSVKRAAIIHKQGGGTGYNFSLIRPRGSYVQQSQGIASGPLSFMEQFNLQTEIINSGNRRGANMGILNINHPDILSFVYGKTQEGKISNFNVSVGINDAFMEAVVNDGFYDLEWKEKKDDTNVLVPKKLTKDILELFITNITQGAAGAGVKERPIPHDLELKEDKVYDRRSAEEIGKVNEQGIIQLRARKVFDLISRLAHETGDPGMIFLDQINRNNPLPEIPMTATNPCLTSDTWIMTSSGPKQIKELIGKQFVALINNKKWASFKKGFFCTGIKKILKIETKEGFEIKLTPNHLVLIEENDKQNNKLKKRVWKEAQDIKSNDRLVLNDNSQIKDWHGIFSEKEGYLLGLLVGDGTIKKDKIILSSWEEDKGAEAVRAIAFKYAKLFAKRKDFKGWMEIKNRNEYRLSIAYLKILVKKLSLNKKEVHPILERASPEFIKGFIRGLLDADGSVQGNLVKGASIRLAQSNLKLLKAVQRMLLRFGIFSKIYLRRKLHKKFFPDGKGGKKEYACQAQFELIISKESLKTFAEKINFFHEIKRKKLEKILQGYKRKLNKENFLATVKKVKFFGYEKVYDTQIPGINSFEANGFIVHNCGEQPLHPFDACNLGSINLANFVKFNGKSEIDYEKLGKTVKYAVRFLDNVNDLSKGPIPEIEENVKKHRRIGLGVMGFADMLIALGIRYDSEQGLETAEQVMEFINQTAHQTSHGLAEEKGVFPDFEKSIHNTGKLEDRMRNLQVTTIAPTGSISMLIRKCNGIEPLYAIGYYKNLRGGESIWVPCPEFEAIAKKRGFYTEDLMKKIEKNNGSINGIDEVPEDVKNIFKTAHDINTEWHIKMQAAWQKHVDNAISKTINMPRTATIDDVRQSYISAWKYGCKGVTVFRDGCRKIQVLEIGKEDGLKRGELEKLPDNISAEYVKQPTPFGTLHMHVSYDGNGAEKQVFAQVGKSGEIAHADLEGITRLSSTILRLGGNIEMLIDQLGEIGSQKGIPTADGSVRSLPEGVAIGLKKYLELKKQGKIGIPSAEISTKQEEKEQTKLQTLQTISSQQTSSHHKNPLSDDAYRVMCPRCKKAPIKAQSGCFSCTSDTCDWDLCG